MVLKTRVGMVPGTVLVLLAVWGGWFTGVGLASSPYPFDLDVPGFTIVKTITGEEARMAIDKLHGLPVSIVRGLVVRYDTGPGKAELWASEAASEKEAEQQAAVMIEKMKANPRSPFSAYTEKRHKDVEIVQFAGMGQEHVVFRLEKWVYWISADRGRVGVFVDHILGTP